VLGLVLTLLRWLHWYDLIIPFQLFEDALCYSLMSNNEIRESILTRSSFIFWTAIWSQLNEKHDAVDRSIIADFTYVRERSSQHTVIYNEASWNSHIVTSTTHSLLLLLFALEVNNRQHN
jgi:hypothetical protein